MQSWTRLPPWIVDRWRRAAFVRVRRAPRVIPGSYWKPFRGVTAKASKYGDFAEFSTGKVLLLPLDNKRYVNFRQRRRPVQILRKISTAPPAASLIPSRPNQQGRGRFPPRVTRTG